MGIIRVLGDALASQIAAGEVVDRPASVAKELLENAVDAGASKIEVYASGGGVERLCVTDNGAGMHADDATLCFSRHATSKIRSLEDLRAIHTFGFRGEALAAIASVAKVRLLTRPAGAETAFEVRVEGGRVVHVGEAGGPLGTRVDVRDLFYNVPARRKFLKTGRTEAAHVENVVKDAGLARAAIGYRFDGDGRRALDLGAADDTSALDHPRRMERVAQCLGEQVRDQLLPFDEQTSLLRLRGYLVAPLESRRDGVGIRLAVNGRPVSDRGLVQAIKIAYRPLLDVGRLPLCALNLTIDPSLVDVNVHPRKAEVRFEDPRQVHGHVIRIVSDFLVKAPWHKPLIARTYRLGGTPGTTATDDQSSPTATANGSSSTPPHDDPAAVHRARVRDALARFQARVQGRHRPTSAIAPGAGHGLRVLGTASTHYLLVADGDALMVVDKQAVASRLAAASLRRALAQKAPEGQPMLFPLRVELSPVEAEVLEQRSDVLTRVGLDVELFGEGIGLCRAVPAPLDAGRAEEITRAALGWLMEQKPCFDAAKDKGTSEPVVVDDESLVQRLSAFARATDAELALAKSALALSEQDRRGAMVRFRPDDLAGWFKT